MADNWLSEITLQKVFSLSPGEAQCAVAARNGLKTSEIAELSDLSENTVRTMLNRGANKMKKTQKTGKLIVTKGDETVEGIMQKMNATRVLLKSAEKCLGLRLVEGNSVWQLEGIDPSEPGDVPFMKEKVFRRVDLFGTSSEKDAENRAQRVFDVQNSLSPTPGAFGIGIIQQYLGEMYMKYDIIE